VQHGVNVEVIFVTAYEKYAIRAIKSSAFDYLLKPVKKADLAASLAKFSEKVQSERMNDRFSQLMYQLSEKKKLKFRNRTGFTMVDPEEILFCQADSNYTVIALEGGKELTVSFNLGKVEEMLPGLCFSRISRSAIVNLHYLAAVDRKNMTCEIVNQSRHTLHVSKKYMKALETDCDKHFSMQQ
jgi:two-component system LytT family response regulator